MRFWKSWIVTQKDLSVIRKNKYVFYSLIAIPLILGIALPTLFVYTLNLELTSLTHDQFVAASSQLVDTATVYLILIAAVLPSVLGSYSFVGEKVEKSLEPLLATPTTDSELLLGKSLATFLPCLAVTYLAAGISAAILDVWSVSTVGYLLVPNVFWVISVFALTPLACLMSVEANIIVSSKVNDVRAAQQLGGLVVLPIIGLIIVVVAGAEISVLIGVFVTILLAIVDIVLFYLSKAAFQREEILTKWK